MTANLISYTCGMYTGRSWRIVYTAQMAGCRFMCRWSEIMMDGRFSGVRKQDTMIKSMTTSASRTTAGGETPEPLTGYGTGRQTQSTQQPREVDQNHRSRHFRA